MSLLVSLLTVPALQELPWLEHGFGTRATEGWTHQPGRVWLHQIHSARVVDAVAEGALGEGDALVTDRAGLLLEIRTADCLPILLCDPVRRAVAAVHAGWRGTVARIAAVTVERLIEKFDCHPSRLIAAIGPGIGPCCFEVGPEVAEQFGQTGRCHVDLVAENMRQLTEAGLHADRIHAMQLCTVCDPARFHSFRRDRDSAGRLTSAIGIVVPRQHY